MTDSGSQFAQRGTEGDSLGRANESGRRVATAAQREGHDGSESVAELSSRQAMIGMRFQARIVHRFDFVLACQMVGDGQRVLRGAFDAQGKGPDTARGEPTVEWCRRQAPGRNHVRYAVPMLRGAANHSQ